MSSSNYPRLLDNDANLFRPVAATAATPALFIGHTDAIERIEPAVGTCDDGTAYGVPGTFNRGLMDHTGLMSTAGPSGRYPWLPRSAASWYGTDNAVPGTWTVDAALTPAFTAPAGPVKVLVPQDGANHVLSVPFTVAAGGGVIVRERLFLGNQRDLSHWVQVVTTAPTYLPYGVNRNSSGTASIIGGSLGAGSYDLDGGFAPEGWRYYWVRWTGTSYDVFISADGVTYDWLDSGASILAPLRLELGLNAPAPGSTTQPVLWFDFVSMGAGQPNGL